MRVQDGGQVAAQQQQRAVGEVHDPGHGEHDDEPDGDQRVHRAEGQPVDEDVRDAAHLGSSGRVVAVAVPGPAADSGTGTGTPPR